jgi:hypothetical protein
MRHDAPAAGCCCRYISALLLSLNTMLHLELPHVNVLSKVDLLPAYGDLGEGRGCIQMRPALPLFTTCCMDS